MSKPLNHSLHLTNEIKIITGVWPRGGNNVIVAQHTDVGCLLSGLQMRRRIKFHGPVIGTSDQGGVSIPSTRTGKQFRSKQREPYKRHKILEHTFLEALEKRGADSAPENGNHPGTNDCDWCRVGPFFRPGIRAPFLGPNEHKIGARILDRAKG